MLLNIGNLYHSDTKTKAGKNYFLENLFNYIESLFLCFNIQTNKKEKKRRPQIKLFPCIENFYCGLQPPTRFLGNLLV